MKSRNNIFALAAAASWVVAIFLLLNWVVDEAGFGPYAAMFLILLALAIGFSFAAWIGREPTASASAERLVSAPVKTALPPAATSEAKAKPAPTVKSEPQPAPAEPEPEPAAEKVVQAGELTDAPPNDTPKAVAVEKVAEKNAKPEADPPAEPAEPVVVDAGSSDPDDLTKIEGIGKKMSAALINQGIDTFAKLSTKSVDELREAIAAEGMRFAPAAESWAEQASFAAKGDWDGLEALQSRLVAGRYPQDE